MAALRRLIGSDHWCGQLPQSSDSRSEHSADECLSEMVVDFLEDHGCLTSAPVGDFPDAATMMHVSTATTTTDCTEALGEIRRMVNVNGDNYVEPYRELLVVNVEEAAKMVVASDDVVLRRRLMVILRELHHNAAICRTKWGSSRGVPGGDYEFVDVVNGNIRYVIDVNFQEQFEIARPTIQYSELLKSLPLIFIGTTKELKKIVRIMCDAAKRSLNCTDLSVPPWRKNSYMQKKWLGSYRRTINPVFDKSSALENLTRWPVKCRWIGFDSAVEVNGGASVSAISIKAV